MKELSIEQKAKAYDEALERAKKVNTCEANDREPGTSICEYIFPELKESEDEKIRKAIRLILIATEDDQKDFYETHKLTRKELTDWLEKQGEQKPAWSEEDEHRIKDTIYFLDTAKKHYACTEELDACINWLKSLRPQSQWKPNNEQMQVLIWCRPLFIDPKSKEILNSLINDLKKLREK